MIIVNTRALLSLVLSIVCFLFQSSSLSLKIGNPVNNYIKTGQSVLFSTTRSTNTLYSYSISYGSVMPASVVQGAVGIIGTTYIIERQHGWSISINSINNLAMTVRFISNYTSGTPSSMVSYMKIRYIVSCHPHIDIDYASFSFTCNKQFNIASHNVTDPNTYDQACRYIRCRKTKMRASYTAPKLTVLGITGTAVLAGFSIFNLPGLYEVSIPTATNFNTNWTFGNYTLQDYYGFTIQLGDFQGTSCEVTITVYGFTMLNRISLFFFSYESALTNTYKTRTISGSSAVGCYYDLGGCAYPAKRRIFSNTIFKTAQTFLTPFYDTMYFFGINHFIIHHQRDDSDFFASPYTDPAVKMSFTVTGSSGNDVYSTDLTFTGNSDQFFTFSFGYIIDVSSDCPTTGDIYHISSHQCDTQCPIGTYQNITDKYCYKCGTRCQECTGPSNLECTNCLTNAQHRVFNGVQCICQTLYYYDNLVSDICPSCSHTCLTCYSSSTSACLSCNLTDNRYDDGAQSCPCLPGYYDGGGRTCAGCHLTCATCTGGATNNCLTCPNQTTTFRNITSNTCACIAGYYHSGGVVCSLCHYSCKTCDGAATTCTSCQPTFKRTLVSQRCDCNLGFYDDGFNLMCQPCFSTCRGCNNPTYTDCTSCQPTIFRALNSPTGQCLCMTSYYEFNYTCVACHYTCLNCTFNTMTSCLNCDAGKFRTKNTVTNECPCMPGYFDLFSSPSTAMCQACHATCQTCSLNATRCLSCRSINKRQLISNSCPCLFGYADVNITCVPCHYTCVTCTGPLSTQCLTCNMTQRFPNGTSCLCRPGTYDDEMQVVCQPCHIHCLECTSGTNDTCTVCDASMQRFAPATVPNFCFCTPHYYNTGPAACSVCYSQCETCEYSSTYCLTCYSSQFRTPTANHTCECMSGYYETGVDICQTCSSRCFECSVISTNCTTCPVLRNFVNNTCVCVDNYYEDTVSGDCLRCGDLCRLCQSSSTQCTDCYPSMNRYLSSLQCICNYGFYNDSTNVNCLPCPYYCHNCSSPTVCLDCSPALFRTMNGTMCSCSPGYYDNGGSAACLACSPVCKQCSDYAVCTNCEANLQRSLILTDCPCVGKFYSIYTLATPTTMCQPCHYSCATCSGGNSASCITCETLRNFTNYSCPCNDGYYDTNPLCNLCNSLCRTCEGISTNCTGCYSGLPLANNTCLCFSGQFMSASICFPCDQKCKQCIGVASFCTQCHASHLAILISNDCVCPTGKFKNSTTLKCDPCHTTCLQCTGSSNLQCTACQNENPVNRVLNSSQCKCKPSYTLNISNNNCVVCHNSCIDCLGPSQYNCSSCQTGFTLIGSYCKPNLICPNYRYEGQCVNICPKNSYPTSLHTCEKCINGCLYCMTATVCLECLTGYVYNSATGTCVAFCSTGTYMSPAGSCIACSANCLECQWNSVKNLEVCLKCAPSYFIRDSQCSLTCLAPRYYAVGSICLRCLGNCETCNSLSASDCVLCKSGTSFLAGQCYQVCPNGYYLKEHPSSQNTCEPCLDSCSSCISGECLSCSTGYHLSNGKCVENGFFYDKENKVLQKCHPNCLSCTSTSFSSCILCRPHRGDSSEMAVSGYCECHEQSIDMGNGVCDYQKFAELLKVTESLVSYSSSTFFLTALTSIVSINCVGMIAMLTYVQAYSNFYFLNSSLVMNVDYVLKEYRKANINSYLHMQSEPVSSRRALVELQSDKSLFMRDQPYKYFVEWGLVPIILISIGWLISLLAFHIKVKMKQYKKKLLIEKVQLKRLQTNESFRSDQQGQQRHKQKIKQKDRNKEKTVQLCLQQLNKQQQEDLKLRIGRYAEKFFKQFHQNFFVIFQLVFSSQLIFYACASFKIMKNSNSSIQTTKFVFSILYFLYFVLYTFRMLIGIFRFSRKCDSLKDKSKENSGEDQGDEIKEKIKEKEIGRNQISVLLHMHLPQKNGPIHAIYLPLTLLRNQIMGILVVFLSSNPNNQIMSCAIVFSIFTIYSLIFCPYKTMFRIFLHISEVVFVLQIIMLSAVSKMEYSQGYNLNILNVDGSYYNFVWALAFLNYIQIILYGLFAISILLHLTIQKFCKRFKNKKQQQNGQKQVKEKQNLAIKKNKKVKNLLTNQQQSTENFVFCLQQENEKQYVQPNDEPGILNVPAHKREQSQSTTIPILMPRRKPIPHRQIEPNNSYLTMNQNNSQNNGGDIKQQNVIMKRYRVKDKRGTNSQNSQKLYFSQTYDPQDSELPYQQLQTIQTGSLNTQKKK